MVPLEVQFRAKMRNSPASSMITLEDCIGLCGLTEEEVLAVAEHERLTQIAATALAQHFLSRITAVLLFEIWLSKIFDWRSAMATRSTF